MAVLTYLRRILESVDHPDMINLILHYLLALPDIVASVPSDSLDVVSAARKRKSMDLATMMASKGENTADPLLFNLVDLILACLRSQSHQTIMVTLQLISVILKRHHRYAVITLLYTERVPGEAVFRTMGAHQQEVEYLMCLAGTVGGQDNFDEIYENVVKDTMSRLENHPCSIKLVTPKTSTNNHKLPAIPDSLPGAPRDVRAHTLRPDDPLLNIILDRLETFFTNPVETNLSLTEAIFDLGVCGFMHLEGWFLRHPHSYVFDDDDEGAPLPDPPLDPESPEYAEYQQGRALKVCRRRPKWNQASLPRLLTILARLCDQVAAYRETIPRFDDLLQQRREAFQTADAGAQAVAARPKNSVLQPAPNISTPAIDRTVNEDKRNSSKERLTGLEGFAQRILSELGTPSRSGSPRGRKEANRGTSDRSTPVIPPYETPLRSAAQGGLGGGTRSYSPSSTSSAPSGTWVDGKAADALANQTKAFMAIDQGILARRVGIPIIGEQKPPVEAIPFNLDKPLPVPSEDIPGEDGNEVDGKADGGDGEDEQTTTGDATTGETDTAVGTDGQDETFAVSEDDGSATPLEEKLVSVSHILTNVMILQSFLFELASLVQVRAGLFEEVRFT